MDMNAVMVFILAGSLACHIIQVMLWAVKRKSNQLSRAYLATRWKLPYMPLGAGRVFYADTHIDNICRQCWGVIDTGKIEYSAPGKLLVSRCMCHEGRGPVTICKGLVVGGGRG